MIKELKDRDDLDLLELVCQLHSRSSTNPQNEKMHESYVEARKELESRLNMYKIYKSHFSMPIMTSNSSTI